MSQLLEVALQGGVYLCLLRKFLSLMQLSGSQPNLKNDKVWYHLHRNENQ